MADVAYPYEAELNEDDAALLGEYDDFEGLVGALRRSAVDAFMRSDGFTSGTPEWVVDGDFYLGKVFTDNCLYTYRCTRPDGSGYGGGAVTVKADSYVSSSEMPGHSVKGYEDKFYDIQCEVNRLVDPWRSLPDPAHISATVATWQRIYDGLALIGKGSPTLGEGSLVGCIQSCLNTMRKGNGVMDYGPAADGGDDAMMGETADAFKRYLENLSTAVAGCRDVAYVLGVALAAQEDLWMKSRLDFVKIVKATTVALDQIRWRGSSSSWTEDASTTSIILAGVSLFAVGVAAPVLGVLSFGLALPEVIAGGGNYSGQGASTYDEALAALKKALTNGMAVGGLNDQIREEERNIRGNLQANSTVVTVYRASGKLDPTPGPIESTDGIIRIDPSGIDDIAMTWMPNISDELARIAGLVSSAVSACGPQVRRQNSIVDRDPDIGIGRNGPIDEFIDLGDVLKQMLEELSWEVTTAAENLRAAVDVLNGANDEAVRRLMELAAMLTDGYQGRP